MNRRDRIDRQPPARAGAPDEPPFRSHLRPRTGAGRLAVALFLALMALAQPPVVHGLADRVTPWVLGLPFLYTYLLLIYSAMIAVLVWTYRRGL